jgi:hypothetical protein
VLSGKALAVGLAVWQQAGFEKRRTVALTLRRIGRLGLAENTARRGLRALEGAGLVHVERRPGRAHRITLLDAPTAEPEEDRPTTPCSG